jgi:hypothetical protein
MVAYTIKKGSHYPSGFRIPKLWDKLTMEGEFMLTPSCWYDRGLFLTNHINKLCGFGIDLLNKNSVRIGWRPALEFNKFEIFAYVHIDGEWIHEEPLRDDIIVVVGVDTEKFSIKIMEDVAIISVSYGSVIKDIKQTNSCGWKQGIYFGGKPTAPQDMTIYLGVR